MKITRISIYKKALTYVGGTYVWGAGNVIDTAMSTIVVIDTDAGISGVGEFCPCGENYMWAHSVGVEAAAKLIAPVAPQKRTEETMRDLDALRQEGYRQFQVKVGCDWSADIDRILQTVPLISKTETVIADANQGWRVDHALRVGRATRHLDYVMEQPCKTYEECQQVRRAVDLPMELDECVTDMKMARRIVNDHGADIVCLKISNVGGLSKAKRIRDFLVDNRMPVVCEDSWGGEIVTAALSHLATSTPSEFLFNTTDLDSYVNESTGQSHHKKSEGKLYAPNIAGLGVSPDFKSLGAPVAIYGNVS